MRTRFFIVPAALLWLASGAGAQTDAYLSTESGATSRVMVLGPVQKFTFEEYEAEWISGAYAMSNGWRLRVNPSSNGIVAQIDKRHPIRLTAVSRDRYITPDGNIAMEFNRGRQGDEMLMSYVPDARTAQVVVVTARAALAQR